MALIVVIVAKLLKKKLRGEGVCLAQGLRGVYHGRGRRKGRKTWRRKSVVMNLHILMGGTQRGRSQNQDWTTTLKGPHHFQNILKPPISSGPI